MTKPQNVKWKTGSIRPVEKRLSECAWKMRWQLNIYRKWQHQTVKNIDGIEKKRRTSAIQGKNRVNIFCALFFFHCLTLASLTFGIHFFIVRNFYLEPNDRNAIITVIISQWMLHSVFALLISPLFVVVVGRCDDVKNFETQFMFYACHRSTMLVCCLWLAKAHQ